MSATLNGGSFRSDDTLYGASHTLKSYLRSILMHKHGIRLIPKSALGHKQTKRHYGAMSALPPKADKGQTSRDVCFVPLADIAAKSSAQLSSMSRAGECRSGHPRP